MPTHSTRGWERRSRRRCPCSLPGSAVLNPKAPAKAGFSWQDVSVTGVRIDKWLWAARFYKTRSLGAKACELGRVQSAGQRVKAAREVHPGDKLQITNDSGDFDIEVLAVSDMRGPASVAQTLYRETDASRELRLKVVAERKALHQFEPQSQSRPSKRDRRRIIQFRGRE